MKVEKTARGFYRADFPDRNGEACSIQESSIATEACLWLGINEIKPTILVANQGWTEIPLPEGAMNSGRMHLTQDQVKDLLPLLQHFAEHGYLPAEEDE